MTKHNTTQPQDTFEQAAGEITAAILRVHKAGVDIGELISAAITDANQALGPDVDVTSNRPGSWEAAALEQLIFRADW